MEIVGLLDDGGEKVKFKTFNILADEVEILDEQDRRWKMENESIKH